MKRAFVTICMLILAFVIIAIVWFFVELNRGFGYKAGSGLGSLVDIDNEKYKHEYVAKYLDSFFKVYPYCMRDSGDYIKPMIRGYEFLNLSNIYFRTHPRETYCVQWSGTGFISVRFAYDYENGIDVFENERAGALIADSVKQRMTTRLRTEVLDKIDSIIAKSADSTVAIYKRPID